MIALFDFNLLCNVLTITAARTRVPCVCVCVCVCIPNRSLVMFSQGPSRLALSSDGGCISDVVLLMSDACSQAELRELMKLRGTEARDRVVADYGGVRQLCQRLCSDPENGQFSVTTRSLLKQHPTALASTRALVYRVCSSPWTGHDSRASARKARIKPTDPIQRSVSKAALIHHPTHPLFVGVELVRYVWMWLKPSNKQLTNCFRRIYGKNKPLYAEDPNRVGSWW